MIMFRKSGKDLSENQVTDVDQMSIKSAIEGAQHLFKVEECMAKFILNHRCCIGEGDDDVNEPGLDRVLKCVREILVKIEMNCRNSIIIVPDLNVQVVF